MLRDKIVLYYNDGETRDKLIKQGKVTVTDTVETFRITDITCKAVSRYMKFSIL